jgi:hypothetical protein
LKTSIQLGCGLEVSYAGRFIGVVVEGGSSYSPQCSVELKVFFSGRGTGTGVLSRLREELIGDAIAVEDIQKLIAEAKGEQERQRQQQNQKASGVKAPL